jgi:hypothetical protein
VKSAALGLLAALGLAVMGCEAPERDDAGSDAARDLAAEGRAGPGERTGPRSGLTARDWAEQHPTLSADEWIAQHPTLSPNAQPEIHWAAVAERDAKLSPGDGGGRARLLVVETLRTTPDGRPVATAPHDAGPLRVGSDHRFEVELEVGPAGIEAGGRVFLVADPFWFWSEAQTADPQRPGFTTAEVVAGNATLEASGTDASFLVVGRRLEPGESIRFVYGAGAAGARVGRYAERRAEILLGVDADGDGRRAWLDPGVRIELAAGPAIRLLATGPTDRAPGEPFSLTLALVDAVGNAAAWPEPSPVADAAEGAARFAVHVLPDSELTLPEAPLRLASNAEPDGSHRLTLLPPRNEGVLRLRVEGLGALAGFEAIVPPIVLRRAERRLVWADLHGHSRLSDGTGEPEDYFRYARSVARLDVAALTDHDHWGVRPLDEDPERSRSLFAAAERFHDPGRFVTLPGFEWTSWLHGHRHVLYFQGEPRIVSSIDPDTDRPDELWAALRGASALTFAHHSAGEPIATNWAFPPDPVLEPLTEIVSVHGTSEAADAPSVVRGGRPGQFVRDVLLRGARLGFVGSGDSHDGHPGLAQLASGQGGLAGIFTPRLDRPALLEAMRQRATLATNGIRPFLEVQLDGVPMGGMLPVDTGSESHLLEIRYEGTEPVVAVELIRSGRIAKLEGEGGKRYRLSRRIPALAAGELHYVRVLETGGGVAWSSPIFAVASE